MITASLAGRRREHGGGLSRQSPDASTAEASPGRVRRGEQGEARRANSTPNGGPHLELGRLWLKIWSKTDFSIAQTTGQHFCTCVFIITAFAIRQCSARPSTLITHKHSPKESQRKPKQNETHEQSLTKLYTYFRLNLDLLHFVAVLGS